MKALEALSGHALEFLAIATNMPAAVPVPEAFPRRVFEWLGDSIAFEMCRRWPAKGVTEPALPDLTPDELELGALACVAIAQSSRDSAASDAEHRERDLEVAAALQQIAEDLLSVRRSGHLVAATSATLH